MFNYLSIWTTVIVFCVSFMLSHGGISRSRSGGDVAAARVSCLAPVMVPSLDAVAMAAAKDKENSIKYLQGKLSYKEFLRVSGGEETQANKPLQSVGRLIPKCIDQYENKADSLYGTQISLDIIAHYLVENGYPFNLEDESERKTVLKAIAVRTKGQYVALSKVSSAVHVHKGRFLKVALAAGLPAEYVLREMFNAVVLDNFKSFEIAGAEFAPGLDFSNAVFGGNVKFQFGRGTPFLNKFNRRYVDVYVVSDKQKETDPVFADLQYDAQFRGYIFMKDREAPLDIYYYADPKNYFSIVYLADAEILTALNKHYSLSATSANYRSLCCPLFDFLDLSQEFDLRESPDSLRFFNGKMFESSNMDGRMLYRLLALLPAKGREKLIKLIFDSSSDEFARYATNPHAALFIRHHIWDTDNNDDIYLSKRIAAIQAYAQKFEKAGFRNDAQDIRKLYEKWISPDKARISAVLDRFPDVYKINRTRAGSKEMLSGIMSRIVKIAIEKNDLQEYDLIFKLLADWLHMYRAMEAPEAILKKIAAALHEIDLARRFELNLLEAA